MMDGWKADNLKESLERKYWLFLLLSSAYEMDLNQEENES